MELQTLAYLLFGVYLALRWLVIPVLQRRFKSGAPDSPVAMAAGLAAAGAIASVVGIAAFTTLGLFFTLKFVESIGGLDVAQVDRTLAVLGAWRARLHGFGLGLGLLTICLLVVGMLVHAKRAGTRRVSRLAARAEAIEREALGLAYESGKLEARKPTQAMRWTLNDFLETRSMLVKARWGCSADDLRKRLDADGVDDAELEVTRMQAQLVNIDDAPAVWEAKRQRFFNSENAADQHRLFAKLEKLRAEWKQEDIERRLSPVDPEAVRLPEPNGLGERVLSLFYSRGLLMCLGKGNRAIYALCWVLAVPAMLGVCSPVTDGVLDRRELTLHDIQVSRDKAAHELRVRTVNAEAHREFEQAKAALPPAPSSAPEFTPEDRATLRALERLVTYRLRSSQIGPALESAVARMVEPTVQSGLTREHILQSAARQPEATVVYEAGNGKSTKPGPITETVERVTLERPAADAAAASSSSRSRLATELEDIARRSPEGPGGFLDRMKIGLEKMGRATRGDRLKQALVSEMVTVTLGPDAGRLTDNLLSINDQTRSVLQRLDTTQTDIFLGRVARGESLDDALDAAGAINHPGNPLVTVQEWAGVQTEMAEAFGRVPAPERIFDPLHPPRVRAAVAGEDTADLMRGARRGTAQAAAAEERVAGYDAIFRDSATSADRPGAIHFDHPADSAAGVVRDAGTAERGVASAAHAAAPIAAEAGHAAETTAKNTARAAREAEEAARAARAASRASHIHAPHGGGVIGAVVFAAVAAATVLSEDDAPSQSTSAPYTPPPPLAEALYLATGHTRGILLGAPLAKQPPAAKQQITDFSWQPSGDALQLVLTDASGHQNVSPSYNRDLMRAALVYAADGRTMAFIRSASDWQGAPKSSLHPALVNTPLGADLEAVAESVEDLTPENGAIAAFDDSMALYRIAWATRAVQVLKWLEKHRAVKARLERTGMSQELDAALLEYETSPRLLSRFGNASRYHERFSVVKPDSLMLTAVKCLQSEKLDLAARRAIDRQTANKTVLGTLATMQKAAAIFDPDLIEQMETAFSKPLHGRWGFNDAITEVCQPRLAATEQSRSGTAPTEGPQALSDDNIGRWLTPPPGYTVWSGWESGEEKQASTTDSGGEANISPFYPASLSYRAEVKMTQHVGLFKTKDIPPGSWTGPLPGAMNAEETRKRAPAQALAHADEFATMQRLFRDALNGQFGAEFPLEKLAALGDQLTAEPRRAAVPGK